MIQIEDIITIDEVAGLLRKSVSWCYANAPQLGAARIGGSLFFRRSALERALEEAILERQANGSGTGRSERNHRSSERKKTPPRPSHPETNPSKYGLADFLFRAGHGGEDRAGSQNVFMDIDVSQALEALRTLKKAGGENAIL
jgi:hypothetical protein